MLKAEGGKDRAFALMVDAYGQRLYWHIRRMLVNHDDTDDILQDTFAKAYAGLAGFRGESSIYTWLFRIATNETLNFIEKRKRELSGGRGYADYLRQNLADDGQFSGSELQRHLQIAIQQLPERQRMVFNLRYFDELKFDDISQLLGVTTGALKASYHHAAQKIRDYFAQHDLFGVDTDLNGASIGEPDTRADAS